MKKSLTIAVSLLFGVCNATLANGISDILKQIEQNNLSLIAMSHDNEAEVLDIKTANKLAGPSVEYSPFFKKGYSGVAQSELIVSQEMEFPTKYAARNRQARIQKDAGDRLIEKLRRDILLEAELLCIDIIRLNQTLGMLNQRLKNSEALRNMYDKRMEAGDANILEVNKVKLDCMEVQTLVNQAQNERTILLQQLEQMNGGNAIDITTTDMPEFPAIADFESYKSLALTNDADIKMAESSLRSAEMDIKIQKYEWLPNITIGYRRNSEQDEAVNGVLVGMNFPLYTNGKSMKAARERRQSAELQVMQAQQEAETSLKSRYQQFISLQQVLDHSDVKMMHETIDLFAKALQHGEITALVYYDEINSIYEKLQRHIDIHFQCTKLLAELHKNDL